jgi:hypothetical protein
LCMLPVDMHEKEKISSSDTGTEEILTVSYLLYVYFY